MFKTLYRCARTAARHENGPAARSRLAYLEHLAAGGSTLHCRGNGYSFVLDALDCGSGKSFAKAQGSASRDKLIHELGVAAEQLRSRAGEPRSSITQYSKPLEIATSASPEALHHLAEAYRRHMALQFSATSEYQLAIDADPNFALAYAGIGSIYGDYYKIDAARTSARSS